MAINFVDGKYVDEKGHVKLDPTVYADWQIAEEAEKTLPSVEFFRDNDGDFLICHFFKLLFRLHDVPYCQLTHLFTSTILRSLPARSGFRNTES